MTREQMKTAVLELLEKSYADMTAQVDGAIDSGAMNHSDEPAESYWQAKAIINAILKEEAKQWEPGQSLHLQYPGFTPRPRFIRLVNNIRACMPS